MCMSSGGGSGNGYQSLVDFRNANADKLTVADGSGGRKDATRFAPGMAGSRGFGEQPQQYQYPTLMAKLTADENAKKKTMG